MLTIFNDGFRRDLFALIIVSIVIGAILANGVASAANLYFGKTISSLIGEYGEYDLAIQVREQMRADAAGQLTKIIADSFPGARLKEGPTLSGRTTFFIALPEKYKTQQIYEEISSYFGSLPGGGSVGIMTEPRLMIRGVPEGAQALLMDKISGKDGVRFVYRDGMSLGIILTSLDKSAEVSGYIKDLLKQYQVVEVTFPVGAEPANPVKLGDTIAAALQSEMNLPYAQNVTVGGKNTEMTYLVGTMLELKRFLLAYAAQVTIKPAPGTDFLKGDTVVFQGTAARPPAPGEGVDKNFVVVKVTEVRPDGAAAGSVVQGDATQITDPKGYLVQKGVVRAYAGQATYHSPRQQLQTALGETVKLLQQVPPLTSEARQSATIALNVLNNYEDTLAAVRATRDGIKTAGDTIASATAGLAAFDTRALQQQLGRSSQAIGGLMASLEVLRLVQSDLAATVNGLSSTQKNLQGLQQDLAMLDQLAADARKGKAAIDSIVNDTDATLAKLEAFDVTGTKENLKKVSSQLEAVNKIDIGLIIAQLQYVGASAPNLKDEDISHSVDLLDKFIAGQVIPGERIQILTTGGVNAKKAEPLIARTVGHDNISVFNTPVGIIEPDARGELYKVLGEVRAVLAALMATIFTLTTLVLDHTMIMTVLKRKRKTRVGARGRLRRLILSLTSPERLYGALIGTVLLTVLYLLSGARVPYVPLAVVPLIGALLGLLVGSQTEKISPLKPEEVMAGEALGLTYCEIMREIVIPGGRPGILQILNRRKVKFP